MSIAAYEDGFDTCEVTGKRIYVTAPKAYVYAKRIQRKNKANGDRDAVHAYRCDACGAYHVGHQRNLVLKRGRPRERVSDEDLAA